MRIRGPGQESRAPGLWPLCCPGGLSYAQLQKHAAVRMCRPGRSLPQGRGERRGAEMAELRGLGIVLAGGAGRRLAPLTADRAKSAVPVGGFYRLVDFALSNLANGGV